MYNNSLYHLFHHELSRELNTAYLRFFVINRRRGFVHFVTAFKKKEKKGYQDNFFKS